MDLGGVTSAHAQDEEKAWVPVTKLGRLVNDGKIKSLEECYLFSLPIKEYQIVDKFLPTLKDEVGGRPLFLFQSRRCERLKA
jgi:small subunit ribosomal protein S2e